MTRRGRGKPAAGGASRSTWRHWVWICAAGVGAITLATVAYPPLRYGRPVEAPAWAAGIREGRLQSGYCISCHTEAGQAWLGSMHQLANRSVEKAAPGASFAGQTVETHASRYTFVFDHDRGPIVRETRKDNDLVLEHRPAMSIGYGTLRQFLIGDQTGRFQATEVAWDPVAHEWFGVFGTEERRHGEWGHWTGQSMTWNAMCARCHMTAYQKGYDEPLDRFASTWIEQGIGCVQCHGPMTGHESGKAALARVPLISRDPPRMMQTCAGCHARAEDLTASAPPGDAFEDHFRLQLMSEPGLYYADGQIRDEVFEWGSFRHSRMAAAGVTCMDCHHAHTGKLKLPIDGNALCMQCHAPDNQRNAPAIHPTAHSFHKPDSTGNSCVACHMMETTYMARDPRRDHGFITPDPLLNKELGIPDACTKCHADKGTDWNIEAWERWYGTSERTQLRRARARAVARAHGGDTDVVEELLRLLGLEKAPGWRASLLDLAARLQPTHPQVLRHSRDLAKDADPLIRATAVRALAADPAAYPAIRSALGDPVRLVRLDAAWHLSPELAAGTPDREELDAYLDVMIDSPVSRLRRGQDRFRRGLHAAGIADARRAHEIDPFSPPIPETLGFMLNATGRPTEAAAEFERAAQLAPTDPATPYFAALAWAEAGNPVQAEAQFRETLRRDERHPRAWYNLGLLLHQMGRGDEALAALARGEAVDPQDADIPYAAATILLGGGRPDEARAALERSLRIDPDHAPARALSQTLDAAHRR